MSRELVSGVLDHVRTMVKPLDPRAGNKRGIWGIKHGRAAMPGPSHYSVEVEMPGDFEPLHLLSRHTEQSRAQAKRQSQRYELEKAQHDSCPDGRWITVHPNGDDEHGHPVYICPNSDGSYTITRGVGGHLNGLRITGVKSEAEYKSLAADRRESKRLSASMEREARKAEIGAKAFQDEQEEKQSRIAEAQGIKKSAEQNFIKAVLTAQGVDVAKVMDAPAEALANAGTDKKIAQRVSDKHHQRLLAYAHKVADAVKEQVSTGLDGMSTDLAGELGADLLASEKFSGAGIGYSSPVRALAEDYGLTIQASKGESKAIRFKSLLDRSGGDLGKANDKRDAIMERTEARRRSDEKVREAGSGLAESGIGPETVSRLSTVPNVQNLTDAVTILKAAKEAQLTNKAAADYINQVDNSTDLERLPKASVVVAKELTDDQAKQAIAETLSQDDMQRSMFSVVGSARDLEYAHGSLREHFSVGQNVAFNTILGALDHSSIDPILHDLLGAAGASAVIAERLHQSLSAEDFAKVKGALEQQHVATQEKIANSAVQEAEEYLERVEALAKDAPRPDSTESLMVASQAQAERVEHLNHAKESIGIALGRLEAAAALNEAMLKRSGGGAAKALQVSCGSLQPDGALRAFYALGLTNPSRYDEKTGDTLHDGDYSLYSDGKNTIATIEPSGIQKLAQSRDDVYVERARISADIKNGLHDEPGWLPEGITKRRAGVDVHADSLKRNSIKHEIGIEPGDDSAGMQQKLRRYIGSQISEGRDPDEIASHVRSEEFAAGMGLDPSGRELYDQACAAENLKYEPSSSHFASERDIQDDKDRFAAWEKSRGEQFSSCLKEFLDHAVASKSLSPAEADISQQTIEMQSPECADAAYVAAMADSRTAHAFLPFGDLDNQGKAAIRSWAYDNVFHLGKDAKDETLQPLAPEEKMAYDAWNEISRHSDPYSAIQQHMQENAPEDLFGERETPPLASVDLSDDSQVIAAAYKVPQLLGYQSVKDADGVDQYPDLNPDSKSYGDLDANPSSRSLDTIAGDARGRIRAALRNHFLSEMAGTPSLAQEGFNPATVKTSGDKFADYAQQMGDMGAYSTIQDYMKGALAERFATELAAKGTNLSLGIRPVSNSERHATAMLPPEKRQAADSERQSVQAQAMRRSLVGSFIKTGSVKDRVDLQKRMQDQSAKLFAVGKDQAHTNLYRASLGDTVEKQLAQLVAPTPNKGGVSAAKNVVMDGKFMPRQRGTKLILQNKRQGVQLGTGSGKTLVALGAFTHALSEGKARRACFSVPSNVVGQFSNEIHAFRDPASPLRWFSTDGESAEKRRAAHSNPNLHIVITTPESLREDVTHAVSKHLNISQDEAKAKIMSEMPERERNQMIQDAMRDAGMDYDFCLQDEGHRMLQRTGKPDAHMQRIGDALSSGATHYIYSTADAVKNDVSEAWSVLHKIDPGRYDEKSRDTFLRKFDRNVTGSALALQREMAPYIYADKIDIGIDENHSTQVLKLTQEQQKAHDDIELAYNQARHAKLKGGVNIEALKRMNPAAFQRGFEQGMGEDEVAKRQNAALAVVRDSAIDKVVNGFDGGAKQQEVERYIKDEANGEPTVVFAHSLAAVRALHKSLKSKGYRVGLLTGDMSSSAKSKAQQSFYPSGNEEPSVDILVSSDAGAVGANLQRGTHLINMDVPNTAMVHRQRIGRIARPGQKSSTVHIKDLVSDTAYDRKNRRRLETKGALREIMTTPVYGMDDSGLTERIQALGLGKALHDAKQ